MFKKNFFSRFQFRNMIRKKAARKTDAYVSRETIDDSDSESDDENRNDVRSRNDSEGDRNDMQHSFSSQSDGNRDDARNRNDVRSRNDCEGDCNDLRQSFSSQGDGSRRIVTVNDSTTEDKNVRNKQVS